MNALMNALRAHEPTWVHVHVDFDAFSSTNSARFVPPRMHSVHPSGGGVEMVVFISTACAKVQKKITSALEVFVGSHSMERAALEYHGANVACVRGGIRVSAITAEERPFWPFLAV